MQGARKQNVKFSLKRSSLSSNELSIETIISEDGIRPVPDKVKAMVKLPQPASEEDVRRLIGTVAPFKDFIHDLSTTMFPIRQLRKMWIFSGYQNMKRPLIRSEKASQSCVSIYDPTKKVTIHADASFTGLVAYTSRALMQTEEHWFQIEKELLAVTFAAEESI